MSRIAFYGNDTYQTLERFRIHYPEAGEKADEFDAIDADEFEKYLVKELIEWFAGPLKDTKPHRYHHNEYKKQACQAATIGLNVSCHHLSLVNVSSTESCTPVILVLTSQRPLRKGCTKRPSFGPNTPCLLILAYA